MKAAAKKKVAVLGASGYTGVELHRLLSNHPSLELAAFLSSRLGEEPEAPALPCDAPVGRFEWERLEGVEAVFLCTPHLASAQLAKECLKRGLKVVDLSADFRFKDAELYRATYEHEHPAPELLPEAVYGLAERARESVRGARLVANPGCYPTSILLPLLPLLERGLVAPGTIVCDSKSGVSGAGKKPSARTHFGASHENFLAYGVGFHRHGAEIKSQCGVADLVFVPHLLPVFRGILSTIYLKPAGGATAKDLRAALAEAYAHERFVKVYPRGVPELDRVQRTNECHIALEQNGSTVVVVSAIDNLQKGASGQALQNMNLMLGLPETEGLS